MNRKRRMIWLLSMTLIGVSFLHACTPMPGATSLSTTTEATALPPTTAASTTAATTTAATTTTTATTTRNPLLDDPSNLLFEDNFDGTRLSSQNWSRCPEWERQGSSVWDNDMSYLDGEGHLVLRAEWDESINKVRAGAVRTYGKFSAGYAYYEASICFPTAPGTWGAFWLMCGDVSEGKGGVEVDIVESIYNERGQCQSALHWNGYGENARSLSSVKKINIYDGNFHTFGLERTAEAYLFYIDGVQVWRVTNSAITSCGDLGYIKLTMEAAAWAGAGTSSCINALPAEMLVDYVRVYKIRPW